jgi:Uma2 family endonuclease
MLRRNRPVPAEFFCVWRGHANLSAMSVALNPPMSLAEFLAWEERQPLRWEFDGERPVAMTGGTDCHSAIQVNLAAASVPRLRGRPCQFRNSDLKIQVAGRIRYPDGFIVCTPRPLGTKVVHDPVVLFEVLSDSTAATDTGAKNEEYAATPSVRRYIILRQDKVAGTMFERIGDDWIGHLLTADSVIRMPEIDIEVPLAEFYADIDFTADS